MQRISTVLLDVGGILLLPTAEVMRAAISHADIDPTDEQLRRAHYAATAAMDANGGLHRDIYRRTFAAACGVPREYEEVVCAAMAELFTGYAWLRVAPHARSGIERLLAAGFRVGIVSNSTGTVDEMLATTGTCQVGPGSGPAVEVIIDSGVVGVSKPDPRIFQLALDALGADSAETAYVGDTARADVDGSRLAGIRPIHLDPYGDCPDPAGDHEHLDRFDRLCELLAG
jgi:putative hydrolase of the HAD superfamily